MEDKKFVKLISELYAKYQSNEYKKNGSPNFYIKIGLENRKHALLFETSDFKNLYENDFKNLKFNVLSIESNISEAWLSISSSDEAWMEEDYVYRKKENASVETSKGLENKTIIQKISLK